MVLKISAEIRTTSFVKEFQKKYIKLINLKKFTLNCWDCARKFKKKGS